MSTTITREQQLEVKAVGDLLSISIGLGLLGFSIELSPGFQDIEITDVDGFIGDVIRELTYEEADGTTLLHRAFDVAGSRAVENGSKYVIVAGEDL